MKQCREIQARYDSEGIEKRRHRTQYRGIQAWGPRDRAQTGTVNPVAINNASTVS